ncbi:MAG: phosphoribosylaminoimidazolesuccinocarboxamide synthase [Candidatus Aenigmarchaeota archaeon]|nr:phosphoribosylaminoimidazolesuccinocarboxamide synthase [Candidatus Aenigmarchaeota archaeon]
MGKVKNLRIIKPPNEHEMGVGIFDFTDDYSIFDYGKMPDTIPGKGESLCRMSCWNFEQIARLGIYHHYRRMVGPMSMEVNLVRVLLPGQDQITTATVNYLIPLEVIYRNSLTENSSLYKLFQDGKRDYHDYGLERMPKTGERFENPIMDFSTKLEKIDRPLTQQEAMAIAGLTQDDMRKVRRIVLKVNDFLNQKAGEIGIEHVDGKVELAMDPERHVMLVDVFGTPDENRFLLNGFQLSKQVLRDHYQRLPWYQEFESKKRLPQAQWPTPPKLPAQTIQAVGEMYKAVCEKWTGQQVWGLDLQSAVSRLSG